MKNPVNPVNPAKLSIIEVSTTAGAGFGLGDCFRLVPRHRNDVRRCVLHALLSLRNAHCEERAMSDEAISKQEKDYRNTQYSSLFGFGLSGLVV
ncbi:MAG: hypothetical protein LBQ70_06470 [Prevotellaceae bacterium]|nr:hypothetical protein [Prevotellaceae bacterium]